MHPAFQVAMLAAINPHLAGVTNVLVAEQFDAPSIFGYRPDDTGGPKGSLTPDTFNGQQIVVFETVAFFWRMMMAGNNVPNTDAIWDQVVVEGVLDSGFGQVILVRSDTVGYNPNDGDKSSWTFDPDDVMVDGESYDLRFTSTGLPFPP